jgi:hypothetical protein
MYLNTRCISSIKRQNLRSATENVKDQRVESINCNLSNLIIFIIFNKLKDDKSLLKLIKNLNFIDENKLSILNQNSLNLESISDIHISDRNTMLINYKKIMTDYNIYDITNRNNYISLFCKMMNPIITAPIKTYVIVLSCSSLGVSVLGKILEDIIVDCVEAGSIIF